MRARRRALPSLPQQLPSGRRSRCERARPRAAGQWPRGRVERAKLYGRQVPGGGEDAVSEPDELNSREHATAGTYCGLPERKKCARDLRSREAARDQRATPTPITAQSDGFRLLNGEL